MAAVLILFWAYYQIAGLKCSLDVGIERAVNHV